MKQSNKIKPKVPDVQAELTMCVSRELNPYGKEKKKSTRVRATFCTVMREVKVRVKLTSEPTSKTAK